MKWMNGFLVLAVGMAVGLGSTGCGGSDDDGDGNPLVGTWEAVSLNGQPIPEGMSVVMTFHDDGTAEATTIIGGQVESYAAVWSTSDGILTVTSPTETDTIPYTISGDTLTILDDGDTVVLNRQ